MEFSTFHARGGSGALLGRIEERTMNRWRDIQGSQFSLDTGYAPLIMGFLVVALLLQGEKRSHHHIFL